MKAKIFLSCGQGKGSNEVAIAEKVAQRIKDDHGFDCYIAITDQTLLGLRENIFAQLETADYLVFIDFKREELKSAGADPICRGSLFSHQELAIASFLNIPALPLQERGVKQRDGMLGVMQGNAADFSDRDQLPNIVSGLIAAKLKAGEWHNQTRNLLTLQIVPNFDNAIDAGTGQTKRFFHIDVRNQHWRKDALNCFVYLDVILNLDTMDEFRPDTIELKWKGTWLANVRIGAHASRKFDALWFPHQTPIRPGFNTLSDWTGYHFMIPQPGKYHLTFAVVSQNFVPACKTFYLEFGNDLNSIVFAEI